MFGLVENIRVLLGNTYYQYCFITHLQNATAIEEQVCWEQANPDSQDCHKYSNGIFIQHLFNIAHSLQRISSKSVRSFATNELHLLESILQVLDGNEIYIYYVHCIDLNNCDPNKWHYFEQAIHVVSSNSTLCNSPGHMFANCPDVTNSQLTYICFQMSISDRHQSTVSAVLDDDSFHAIATMLTALSLRCQDFWKGHSYSKATDSASAALQGGTEFSTFSPEYKNCANFSTISVSTEYKNGDNFYIVSSECKNWENHTHLQALISTIRRLKCNLIWLEKLRQVILLELQQQGSTLSKNMIKK